ncbi:hypothetical protein B7P43_G03382, partial [Cryptotermes secundus]
RATNSAVTEEFPSILWNPKVYYPVHKSPPLIPILSQYHPIHNIPSYLSRISFNIFHPPTPWFSQWSLDWIDLAQDREQWKALVSTVINLRVP